MRQHSPTEGSDTFQLLLKQARAGSREAMGEVLQLFRRYLLRLGCEGIQLDLQSKGTASDLVQDTYLEAQQAFAQFKGNSQEELRAWLRQILVHNLANFRRDYLNRAKRRVNREVSLDHGPVGARLRREVAGKGPSPTAETIRFEQAGRLSRALETLPALYRSVIHSRATERLPFDQIGGNLGCSAEAARKLWTRALKRLALAMEAVDLST